MSLAQENIQYQLPPEEILTLADFDRAPSVSIDSKKNYMLFSYANTYKTLEDLTDEEMKLAGLRINPTTNISSTVRYINNLKLKKISEREERQVIGLPIQPRLAFLSWSPNENYVAFTHTDSKGVELWLLDVASGTAKKLYSDYLNANLGQPFIWAHDSKSIFVQSLPKNRASLINKKESLPLGPIISVGDGSVSQNRTYQDLLKDKVDEQNFETLARSEIIVVSISGEAKKYRPAGIYSYMNLSPDGKYLMVTVIVPPYSYIVPMSRFPQMTQVYDMQGKLVKEVNNVPLVEVMPKGFSSVRTGKRNMNWRSDKSSTLFYVEALDEGDSGIEVNYRDEMFLWEAPFKKEPISIGKTKMRFSGVIWGDDDTAIVFDRWYNTREMNTYLINPSQFNDDNQIIFTRNYQDTYSDPGSFETKKNTMGRYVLSKDEQHLFLIGDGFTKDGQFPFIDQYDLKTGETKRLYTCNLENKKEDLLSYEDVKKGEVLVRIESQNEYPNYYLRNLRTNELRQLTYFKNPFESLNNVYKEVINYTRKDGVELSGTLYLPENYNRETKSEKLPLLIWAYPREFKDKSSAGQTTQNPNSFTFPYYGSFVYWVTRGYAVLDNAAFPIVGEGDTEPNDTFIQQLIDNADAAIQAVDNLGYINPKKVGVGGHSYGAFMTANLLTHSNLFACGIARSGAYNRTLTPFGFQSEQRNYWDVPDVYNTMSPFMNAHKMKTPMLLTHGEADNNPGTFTLQTERYFQALKNLGAPVRMVILPKESHGYVAKENIFHLLWEQDQFLEKYLKND